MKRWFGTDGIRGVAGQPPLDPGTVRRFGTALGRVLEAEHGRGCRVVLGRDTRESGPWLADAVAAGLAGAGVAALGADVITTPGLAHVVAAEGLHAGVMISASHNPFQDNGLKVFGRGGTKLTDALELRVEQWMLDDRLPDPGALADPFPIDPALVRRYVEYLQAQIPPRRLAGLRIVLDCAHGSAGTIAPAVFRHHGAVVSVIGDRPTGRNINLGCGSLHLEALGAEVRRSGSDVGIAFDGDADRALAVDRRGRAVDGDHVLYFTARQLKRGGALAGDAVVATIMSNLWLEQRLRAEGIRLHRAAVGDKYVHERMVQEGACLGGEQSGHVIFRDRAQTGDGILTGLMLLDALLDEAEPLETLLDGIVPCPQVLLAVRVREKPDLRSHPRIGPVLAEVEARLDGTGRVVLRYSGTEPVARVMVEGGDREAIELHARRIAGVIEQELAG